MPKTKPGIWSLVLVVAMPILLMIGPTFTSLYEDVPAGDTLLQDIINRPLLSLTMLTGFSCGIAAFITGLIALIKEKDRSLLVLAATIIGGCTVLFVIFQVVFRG